MRAIATMLGALALLWLSLSSGATAQVHGAADEAEARRLYALGKVEYVQGRFVEASERFGRAYALSGAPDLLFNMAQAHRLSGAAHCPEALALYRSYLAALPAADNHREVEEFIAELEPCPAPPPAAATPGREALPEGTPPSRAEAQPAPRRDQVRHLGPIVLSTVGAVLLAAGGAVYARAAVEHAEAERECPCYPGTLDRWKRLTVFSYVALGTGGAVLASGVSWWVFASPDPQAPGAALGATVRF
jgi:tetratricopeptide (TPR) repeat protein